MKKLMILTVLIGVSCLFTGCLKIYKEVSEYVEDMNLVQKETPSYSAEVKRNITINNTEEITYKTYKKGDKWKTEQYKRGGGEVYNILIFDGEEVYSYAPGSKFAVSIPKLNNDKAPSINQANPLNPLFEWSTQLPVHIDKPVTPEFVNNKEKKNGFDCRLISYGPERTVCVSDKYGIAVYEQISFKDRQGKNFSMETNVTSVDTTELDDSVFELPENVKKLSINEAINEMKNLLKTFKK